MAGTCFCWPAPASTVHQESCSTLALAVTAKKVSLGPACAHREAREEIGANVTLRSVEQAWHLPRRSPPVRLALSDCPRPLAVYEMEHPPGTPRAGGVYYLVIYLARLQGQPRDLAPEEVQGVIALTAAQVVQGEQRRDYACHAAR